jgi:hypothetical protein
LPFSYRTYTFFFTAFPQTKIHVTTFNAALEVS